MNEHVRTASVTTGVTWQEESECLDDAERGGGRGDSPSVGGVSDPSRTTTKYTA